MADPSRLKGKRDWTIKRPGAHTETKREADARDVAAMSEALLEKIDAILRGGERE